MDELSGMIGRRLNGDYQMRLFQMKARVRQNQRSNSLSSLKTIESRQTSDYSENYPIDWRSASKQRSTIPQSNARRDSHLLPKVLSEYQLGYAQRIGQSHQKMPKNSLAEFGNQVSRDKVYFLKEQTKVFDEMREVNQRKHFQILTNEMTQYKPDQLKSQQLLYKNFDQSIHLVQEKAKTDGKRLRRNLKEFLHKNRIRDLDEY